MDILETSCVKPAIDGGVSSVEYNLINALRGRGYKVDEFFPKLPSMALTDFLFGIFLQDPYPGYVVHSHTNISWWDKGACRTFHGCTAQGAEIAKIEGNKVLKGGAYLTINSLMENLSAHHNKCIAVSNYTADAISKYYNIARKDISVVHNGIDVEKFKPNTKNRNKMRADHHIPKNAFVITWTGHFEYNKGISYLKEIIDYCAQDKNIYFVIRSSVKFEDIPEEYQWVINTPHVIFLRHGENMVDFYNMGDLHLMTSTYDPMPLTVLEAMACGKAVIAPNSGGHAEVIQTGINGYIVNDYRDTKTMADTIKWLSKSKTVIKELGKYARKRIESKFTIYHMLDNYLKIFREQECLRAAQ